MYCSLCEDFISIFSIKSYCSYCEKLRRLLLVYGKEKFANIIDLSMGVNIMGVNILDKEITQDEKIDVENKSEITIHRPVVDNLMSELTKRRKVIN